LPNDIRSDVRIAEISLKVYEVFAGPA
jgi:hypothetical protein